MNSSKSTTFSDFSSSQIKKFKEAFEIIDDDGDGHITTEDLRKIFVGLGTKTEKDGVDLDTIIKEMFDHFDGADSITYPQYLSLMGSLIGDFPERADIESSLRVFCSSQREEDMNAIDYDELVSYLNMKGFDNEDEIHKALKNFSFVNKLTGQQLFKGAKFLETITE